MKHQNVYFIRVNVPRDKNNGHKGAYWGPGMGCGEDWTNSITKQKNKSQHEIDQCLQAKDIELLSHLLDTQLGLVMGKL